MALATKPKPPAHYKKASGKHHKPGKLYLKTYWPYLPIALVVGIGLFINNALTTPPHILGAASDFTASSLLTATNEERTAASENPLQLNQQLMTAAQTKANDMVTRNYWSHNTPDDKTPWSFMVAAGYNYAAAGENLAYGFSDASDVLDAWMNSAEHRANVLSTNYQAVGFGVASSPDYNHSGPQTLVVAMYASPVTATATSNVSAAPPLRPVARLQLMTRGHAPWTEYAVLAAGSASLMFFVLRHGKAWHKALLRGEDFLLEHIWIDMLIVTIAMGSYVLLQSVGSIG